VKSLLNNSSTPLSFNHKTWSLGRDHGMKMICSLPEITEKNPVIKSIFNRFLV